MKVLIGFILALFISSHAYAQSAVKLLEKGKIILEYEDSMATNYNIVYENKLYYCKKETDRPWANKSFLIKFCKVLEEIVEIK